MTKWEKLTQKTVQAYLGTSFLRKLKAALLSIEIQLQNFLDHLLSKRLSRQKMKLLTVQKYDAVIFTYSWENYHLHDFEHSSPQYLTTKGHILLCTAKELLWISGTAHTCLSSLVFLYLCFATKVPQPGAKFIASTFHYGNQKNLKNII